MNIKQSEYSIETSIDGNEIMKQIERVGRTCYKSENQITNSSADKFVRGLIKRGHEAMIEHNAITVRFTCDRGVSHEIVRHRVASFGQESTRYCNYAQDKFSNQISVIDISNGIKLDLQMQELDFTAIYKIISEWKSAMEDAEHHYFKMLKLGSTPQIARSVLPNSLKTEIVVTMNVREWRHFFMLRASKFAHPQMRELAMPLLNDFKVLMPAAFDDITPEV